MSMLRHMVDWPTISMVPPQQTLQKSRPGKAVTHLWAVASVATATAVSWMLHGPIADESLSMVFLSAVLVSSVAYGRNVGIAAAILAFLSYNVLILEPRFSFRFTPLSDTLTLAVFLAVALLTGGLAGRVRDQAIAMAKRASTMTMLFSASQALARSSDRVELVSILANQVALAIGSPAYVFVRSDDTVSLAATGKASTSTSGSHAPWQESEIVTFAQHAWAHIGATDATLPTTLQTGTLATYPLGSLRQPMGLLICEQPAPGKAPGMDKQTFAVFCELGAIALERACLIEEMTKTRVVAETDRLRTALLSSISHDFRTPLAGILASATGLIEHGDAFSEQSTRELLGSIRDQAELMNRYIANLLDMIKLESGSITVTLEPTDPLDIIAAASRRCSQPHAERGSNGWLSSLLPSQPCLVEADPVLLEQAIFNVLENAFLYSPPSSVVEISLHASLHLAEIIITDAGPGIPPEHLERVFDKFHRVNGNKAPAQGTGLGLSISRGLIEAMGGTVSAVSPVRNGRGTAIHICLRRVAEP